MRFAVEDRVDVVLDCGAAADASLNRVTATC